MTHAPAGLVNGSLDCCLDLGGLDETLAQNAELGDVLLAQLMVSVGQVIHRAVEPFLLVFGGRADDTALHDMLEHLVARILERGCSRRDFSSVSILQGLHQSG